MLPLIEKTNESQAGKNGAEGNTAAKYDKPRVPRERKQRGPPEDGIVSKVKVMVANLPYDLSEDRVSWFPLSKEYMQTMSYLFVI